MVEISDLLLFLIILLIQSIFRCRNFRTGLEAKVLPFVICFGLFLSPDILILVVFDSMRAPSISSKGWYFGLMITNGNENTLGPFVNSEIHGND